MHRLRKHLRTLLLAALAATCLLAYHVTPYKTIWAGSVDEQFVQQIRSDTTWALREHRDLYVELMSPGGSVIWLFEATRLMREAESKGLIIEVHANSLTASAATAILSAGSKGYRYANRATVALVHPPQVGGGFMTSPHCGDYKEVAKLRRSTDLNDQVNAKVLKTLLDIMTFEYVQSSGRSVDEVIGWMTCGKEQVGDGSLLVRLGLADWVE